MAMWILIIVATIGYAFFQFFSAKAGGKIDGGLVPVIVNLVAVVIPLSLLMIKVANKGNLLTTTRSGIVYASLAGLGIAMFAIAFHKIFQYGGNLSYVSPLVFGASIALSTLLSVLFLKETLTVYHLLGIALVVSGIALISFARAQ